MNFLIRMRESERNSGGRLNPKRESGGIPVYPGRADKQPTFSQSWSSAGGGRGAHRVFKFLPSLIMMAGFAAARNGDSDSTVTPAESPSLPFSRPAGTWRPGAQGQPGVSDRDRDRDLLGIGEATQSFKFPILPGCQFWQRFAMMQPLFVRRAVATVTVTPA